MSSPQKVGRRQLSRRSAMAGGVAAAAAAFGPAFAETVKSLADQLSDVERRIGGTVGTALLDTGRGRTLAYRADERVALCSTFKLLAAALVLRRVDLGQEQIDRRVTFGPESLVTYSPVTEKRIGPDGMTMAEICHAAVTTSDNTAGNLMLASFGGPAGLTQFMRATGDETTRLDRIETELNDVRPGDPRDTTTAAAMLGSLQRLLVGDVLSAGSRDRLRSWLVANQTGDHRIRAGTPAGWIVGDKTGTGPRGQIGDVAILWPKAGAAPLLLTVYLAGSKEPAPALNEAIRDVAAIVIRAATST